MSPILLKVKNDFMNERGNETSRNDAYESSLS